MDVFVNAIQNVLQGAQALKITVHYHRSFFLAIHFQSIAQLLRSYFPYLRTQEEKFTFNIFSIYQFNFTLSCIFL